MKKPITTLTDRELLELQVTKLEKIRENSATIVNFLVFYLVLALLGGIQLLF